VDDERIRQLTDEVLSQLATPKETVAADLETRVSGLERRVLHVHPSHQLLDVPGGSTDGRCVLEPDKPCVQSGQCRTLGH